VNINIPAGYKINYLPKNQTFSNEVGSLEVNYKEKKEKIMVDFNLIVDRKEISADEYKMARKLLNKAGSSLQNQIMVKNTNN
jgi:tRNA C32,U32 (ribose-2'-O)-methylase TrmJ